MKRLVKNNGDEILKDFINFQFNVNHLPMITVYYNASDYPGIYVARLFYCIHSPFPTRYIIQAETEQEIHDKIPGIFHFLNRSPEDEAQIVGSYI